MSGRSLTIGRIGDALSERRLDLMATVFIQKRKREKTKRSVYVVTYKHPKTLKTQYYKTFHRLRDAQEGAYLLRSMIDTGQIQGVEKRRGKPNFLTFSDVCKQLQFSWKKRLETGGLSQKTFTEYIYILNSLRKVFGERMLSELTEKDVLGYQSHLAKKLSNISSNRHLFVLKQVFKQGAEERAVFNDVAAPIKYLSEKKHIRNRFLFPEEIDRLAEVSRKRRSGIYLRVLIFLGVEHGASRQEALSLEWSDINFGFEGHGTIRLFRKKNTRERFQDLMPRTRGALLEWRDHLYEAQKKRKIRMPDSHFVFSRIDGTPIKRFDKAWRATCRAAGFEGLHFHDLRHTYCSNLLMSGSSLKDVKEMIGHSDLSMTERYSHLSVGYQREQQKRLAEHYQRNGASGLHRSYTEPDIATQ